MRQIHHQVVLALLGRPRRPLAVLHLHLERIDLHRKFLQRAGQLDHPLLHPVGVLSCLRQLAQIEERLAPVIGKDCHITDHDIQKRKQRGTQLKPLADAVQQLVALPGKLVEGRPRHEVCRYACKGIQRGGADHPQQQAPGQTARLPVQLFSLQSDTPLPTPS